MYTFSDCFQQVTLLFKKLPIGLSILIVLGLGLSKKLSIRVKSHLSGMQDGVVFSAHHTQHVQFLPQNLFCKKNMSGGGRNDGKSVTQKERNCKD